MEFFPEDIDKYYTIKSIQRTEIKVKGSKFIATIAPAKSKQEALEFLEEMRSEFYDATHNCYAYRIGWDGTEFRAADDGEPAGSAGKPILFTIDKYNVQDVIVVVTRYFGGTKLGVGGLVRAYSDSTEETLKEIEKVVINRTKKVRIVGGYEDISFIKRQIDPVAVKFEEEYTDKVEFLIDIPLSKVDSFVESIFSKSNAKLKAEIVE
jgi:uncharacterized YigZ family protein